MKCGGQILRTTDGEISCLQCGFIPDVFKQEQPSQNLRRDRAGIADARVHREYNSYDARVKAHQQGKFKTAQARCIRNVA
jgi:hypothetical protein